MITINDSFNIPEVNNYRQEHLIENQKYFWFISSPNIIHTECCDITKDKNNNFVTSNIKNHQPYIYLSEHGKLEEDFKTYNLFGITNNDANDYYDLKVDKQGFFYTKIKTELFKYNVIIEQIEAGETITYELNKSNPKFKFIEAYLYKHGEVSLTSLTGKPEKMNLNRFIVGFTALINVTEDKHINIEATATIPNLDKKSYPGFSVKLNPNFTFSGNVKVNTSFNYINVRPIGMQEIPENSQVEFIIIPEKSL